MSVARSRRWTTRTAVAQTLRILRRDGVAAAWFGALAETVYRRLLVVERDVTVAADAGIARGRYPLSAIEVRTVDVDAVAALYAAIGVERIPDISRRAGETWFAAYENIIFCAQIAKGCRFLMNHANARRFRGRNARYEWFSFD